MLYPKDTLIYSVILGYLTVLLHTKRLRNTDWDMKIVKKGEQVIFRAVVLVNLEMPAGTFLHRFVRMTKKPAETRSLNFQTIIAQDSMKYPLMIDTSVSNSWLRAENCSVFRRVRANQHRRVRLSLCISADHTGRISVKFDIAKFYKNPSRNSRFVQNLTKMSGALHEDLSTFYCCLRYKLTIRALLCGSQYFCISI